MMSSMPCEDGFHSSAAGTGQLNPPSNAFTDAHIDRLCHITVVSGTSETNESERLNVGLPSK